MSVVAGPDKLQAGLLTECVTATIEEPRSHPLALLLKSFQILLHCAVHESAEFWLGELHASLSPRHSASLLALDCFSLSANSAEDKPAEVVQLAPSKFYLFAQFRGLSCFSKFLHLCGPAWPMFIVRFTDLVQAKST